MVRNMALNLGSIRNMIQPISTSGVPRTPEEMCMLQNLAPTVNSYHVQNKYILTLKVLWDGCCVGVPDFTMPITIIPIIDLPPVVQPMNFAPKPLVTTAVSITTTTTTTTTTAATSAPQAITATGPAGVVGASPAATFPV